MSTIIFINLILKDNNIVIGNGNQIYQKKTANRKGKLKE